MSREVEMVAGSGAHLSQLNVEKSSRGEGVSHVHDRDIHVFFPHER